MQYLKSLNLKNIRSFKALRLSFSNNDSGPTRTLIIGRNGTGKTTLLRSLVLGVDLPGGQHRPACPRHRAPIARRSNTCSDRVNSAG